MSFVPLPDEIVDRFRNLAARAVQADSPEPTAVTLSTADARGRPSSRTVLLKGFDEQGFVFYTNVESRKAAQLRENPRAALTFYWPLLGEQVQVEGDVELVSDREADEYFATRPRESQLGAWASIQSAPLPNRWSLLRRMVLAMRRFQGGPVPRPPNWSGYRVRPDRVEFWISGAARLHVRDVFVLDGGRWTATRLYP